MADISPNNPFADVMNDNSQQPSNPQQLSVGQGGGQISPNNPFADIMTGQPPQQNNTIVGSQGGPIHQGTFWDNVDILNRNFATVANGSLQEIAKGLSFLGIDTSQAQKELALNQAIHERDFNTAMQNSPKSGSLTNIASQLGAAIASPGAPAALAMSSPMVAMGIASAINGGAQYVPDNSDQSHLGNALQQGVVGSALGGIGQLAGKALGAGMQKLSGATGDELANNFNQGLTTLGTATGNPIVQNAENVLGKIPVMGAKANVGKVAENMADKTQSVLDDLNVSPTSQIEVSSTLKDIGINNIDQTLGKLAGGKYPSLTNDLMNQLSDDGKQTLMQGILSKVVQGSADAKGNFSLVNFSKNLNNMAPTLTTFPGDAQAKIQGLQTLLSKADGAIRGEAQQGWLKNTLEGIAAPAGLYGVFHFASLPMAIGSAAFTKGLSYILTNPKMTANLIKLAGGKLADTASDNIIKASIKTIIQKGIGPVISNKVNNIINQQQSKDQPITNGPVQALGIGG